MNTRSNKNSQRVTTPSDAGHMQSPRRSSQPSPPVAPTVVSSQSSNRSSDSPANPTSPPPDDNVQPDPSTQSSPRQSPSTNNVVPSPVVEAVVDEPPRLVTTPAHHQGTPLQSPPYHPFQQQEPLVSPTYAQQRSPLAPHIAWADVPFDHLDADFPWFSLFSLL